jgi:tripartite-type tricarboxylate transporter receptor subunit TctC
MRRDPKAPLVRFFLLCALLYAACAGAQEYPAKPIRIIVPYAAGGGTDTVARLVAAKMAPSMGQPVVVENRPGASSNIGTEAVAKAPADGYTVLVTAPNFPTSETLFEKLSWRIDDFAPVIQLVRYANVLVASTASQLTSVEQLVARAKASPGSISFGTPGTASASHLAVELLKQRARIELPHIPYKGSGPLKNDLLGGHIPLGADGLSGQMDLIKAGKVRALAILGPRRSPFAPEVPSLADLGIKDVDGTGWYGALVPVATPAPVVSRLHREFAAAMQAADVRERVTAIGAEPVAGSSEEFRAFLLNERSKWAAVIKAAKVKPD